MSNVVKLPTPNNDKAYEDGAKLITRAQKAIKKDIDMHHELMNHMYGLEKLILQDTQTELSEDALQGVNSIIRWSYDKTQKLSDLI